MNRGLRSVSKTLGLNSPIVAVALFVQWSQITIQLTNWEIPIIKCTHTSSGPFLSNVLRFLIDFAHVQKKTILGAQFIELIASNFGMFAGIRLD